MRKITSRAITLSFIVLFVSLFPSPSFAFRDEAPQPFWWGLDLGYGSFGMSHDYHSSDYRDSFFLGFKGGVVLDPSFRLGVEVSGWTLEAEDSWDPEEGEGLSQYQLVAILTPPDTGFSVTGAFGYADYWNNSYREFDGQGWSATFGLGYDLISTMGFTLTPGLTYTYGRVRDKDLYEESSAREFDVLTFKVGISYGMESRDR